MRKAIIVWAALLLCGCAMQQKPGGINPAVSPTPQPAPAEQSDARTNPSAPPAQPFSPPSTSPEEAIEYFARLLDVNVDHIYQENFTFATLSGDFFEVSGPTVRRAEYPKRNYAVLNEMFSDWQIYNSTDGIEESAAFYLKDNVICKKHLILNDPENAWENLDATEDLRITCGENPASQEELFPEQATEESCFDMKVWLIEQSDEMRPYIEQMEKDRQLGEQQPGFVSFNLTIEKTDEYADYLVLTEYHREPDGSLRELPTRRFRFNHDYDVPFMYDPVGDAYEELHYSDPGTIERFVEQCE